MPPPVEPPPTLRAARPDEAPALSAIARAAKAHWGYPERWLELWRDALTVSPEFVAAHPVFVAARAAAAGERLAGWGALVPPGADAPLADLWTLEHLWVLPGEMGRGVGRRLFAHCVAHARRHGAAALAIDGDPNALPFYLKVGARQVGEIRDSVDGQPRVRPLLRVEL